jgi:hypothetical protein
MMTNGFLEVGGEFVYIGLMNFFLIYPLVILYIYIYVYTYIHIYIYIYICDIYLK